MPLAPPTIANPSALPLYLQPDQTSAAAIKARLLASFSALRPDVSTRIGGLADTVLGAISVELSQVPPALGRALNNTFAQTARDDTYILARAAEQSLFPTPAVAAVIPVTFTAPMGTVYPQGTRVATPPPSGTGLPIVFATNSTVTVPVGGTVTVGATCTQAGVVGNVGAGAITTMVDHVAGTAGVTNGAPTTLGIDQQSAALLLVEYLNFWQNQPTSGNPAEYYGWAFEASPGVGGAVITRTPVGPGSVGISLLGTDGLPASSGIVTAVTAYITPTLIAGQGQGAIGPTDLLIYAAPSDAIAVVVTVTYDPAVVPGTLTTAQVNAAIKAALIAYYAGIAFAGSNSALPGADALNDVQPDKIAGLIGSTVGILGYNIASLTVNGGTSTVAVLRDHVAVHGSLTVNGVLVP